jgi:hypothetical protein
MIKKRKVSISNWIKEVFGRTDEKECCRKLAKKEQRPLFQ